MVVTTEAAFEFDLSGGSLCLDFINTVSDRAGEPREHLNAYADVLEFAWQAGAMPQEEVEELAAEAKADPSHAARVTGHANRARESMYRIFRAVATGKVPQDPDLEALNAVLVEGLAKARLVREGNAYRWSWAGDCSCLERPLWQIVHSAADLLASGRLDRVRLCGSDTCEWLFLDESRNRSRRWCAMSTCGNREKARRHYQKVRQAEH
jgi:predicted RNA-binding Zn ribbon-like protein